MILKDEKEKSERGRGGVSERELSGHVAVETSAHAGSLFPN
jgi:hypothetical protein